ncbi:phage antirepressor KilAC domain-containing protein [Pseudomonas auratipiscis]|uniref:Phage antirepressor KilAC domain-containing protein n=2 Tax=Pseudomonas auratipiscis TaxID=3115853 RepID=A0AB35WRY5_9PSED|nr:MULTISPECIES: phage antirepressor KilAC domain-containing protein [unclassified Pseudomonas]MEE1866911.1 phage antirepressor KilAC domain-containing protein [Pseudomonas sp. 120P]MEE1960609.1 phage antirepressor KilAC domain-containing protein [Pseudomonas sp. 119P]
MSSREIADLVEARHNDVVATIDRLFEKGLLRSPRKTHREATGGRPVEVYDLIERDTHLVVAGYSDEHRARVIDRWQELEGRVVAHLQVPTNFADALRLAAEQVEKNQQLQQVIERQAPKIAAIKRLAAASGAICITDAAKHLQLQPSKLFDWLEQHRWIYRRKGSRRWIAYQPRITAGLMKHKVTDLKPDPETGLDRAAFDVLVTPKGLSRLAELQAEGSM